MNQSETKALEALQNGSDIRGIAIATEKYQITLTDERRKDCLWLCEMAKRGEESGRSSESGNWS